MAKAKKSKAPVPRHPALTPLPKREPGAWDSPVVFRPKNSPPDVNKEFAFQMGKSNKRPCARKKGKDTKLRTCHVELLFDSSGSSLRLCSQAGVEGVRIPVQGPADTTRISNEFCACQKQGQTAQACATKLAQRK